VEFLWDARKNRANTRKHGIDFETAIVVFDDPFQVTLQDREVEGEQRWHTIGMVNDLSIVLVVHTNEGEDLFESFPLEKRRPGKGPYMPTAPKNSKAEVRVKRLPGQPLTAKQKRMLSALAALPDSQIDTSDIPELPPGAWKNAVRGKFYRPIKQAISMRLDADIIAWLKKPGKGYQTRANSILRRRMLDELNRA
jgi:uncharacterized DUF497 family protein/uncharacterized protein (DUF4415 family)